MTQYMQEAGAMKQATIADAPAVLNTNDKAMWVLGFNAALTAQAWQPIETAPKDGSLLLLSTAKGVVVIGKRNKHLHIWVEVDGRETPRQITYWMPLPAPPLAANEGTLTAGKQGGDGVTTVAPAPRSDRATCPAHGGDYHWTLDCPECVKDAQARGMSIDTYYSRVRPTLRPAGVASDVNGGDRG